MTLSGTIQIGKEKKISIFLLRSSFIKDDDMLWMMRKENQSEKVVFSTTFKLFVIGLRTSLSCMQSST